MAAPLSHIRVIDLSRALAGPLCRQILADLGADVIKVERPPAGDETRAWGPPFLADDDGVPTQESAYYLSVNRGKRSIALDLGVARDREIARALANHSDVLIENFRVGTMARFGLAYEDLKNSNPRLVYCSLTGFGQTGPRSGQAAYDFASQALGGLMSLTGVPDGEPGAGPMKVGVPIVDMSTGLYGVIAVLAALLRREQTGTGEQIDIGMLDVTVATLLNHATSYLVSGEMPRRPGNAHPSIQPQDVYQCRDGALALVVGNDSQFAGLCEALEMSEMAYDPRFQTNSARVRNMRDLSSWISERLALQDRSWWSERLEALGVPCAPINSVPEVLADPQVEHRGMKVAMAHPLAGTLSLISSPMKFTESALVIDRSPPLFDQHRPEILDEVEGFRAQRTGRDEPSRR